MHPIVLSLSMFGKLDNIYITGSELTCGKFAMSTKLGVDKNEIVESLQSSFCLQTLHKMCFH